MKGDIHTNLPDVRVEGSDQVARNSAGAFVQHVGACSGNSCSTRSLLVSALTLKEQAALYGSQ